MSLNETEVFDAALNLPTERRWDLAEQLLDSIEVRDSEIERAGIEEAKRRLQAVRAGTMETIPADEVFRRIRER